MRGAVHVEPLGQLGQQPRPQFVRRKRRERGVVGPAAHPLLGDDGPQGAVAAFHQQAAVLGLDFQAAVDGDVLAVLAQDDVLHGPARPGNRPRQKTGRQQEQDD